MHWTNIGLVHSKNLNADRFTSTFGIRFRRFLHPLVHFFIRLAVDRPIEIVKYPVLPKDENFIFAAGHSFPGEVASNLAVIDRNAWILAGTTDQIDHNPQMYAAWLNGMIYVNKLSPESRSDASKKMKRILNSGSSILLFPEGVLNNSENLLCMPVYPGFYHLAQETKKRIIPIVSHAEHGADTILVAAGEPIDVSQYEAMDTLRDALSSLRYELIALLPPLNRSGLAGDIHLQHMEKRRKTYLETKWIKPIWDEEIVMYRRRGITYAEDVRASLDKVKITPTNAAILAPVLLRREMDETYDIKQYMKNHWREGIP